MEQLIIEMWTMSRSLELLRQLEIAYLSGIFLRFFSTHRKLHTGATRWNN